MRFILCWLLLGGLAGVHGEVWAGLDNEVNPEPDPAAVEVLEVEPEAGEEDESVTIFPRSDERSQTAQRSTGLGSGRGRGNSTDFIIIFLLLVAAGGLALYIRQRGVPWKALGQKPDSVDRKLELVEMKNLGSKQFLVVARYEQKRFLLGVYPGRVDFLCWLSGEDRDAPPPDLAGISPARKEDE